MLFLLQNGCKRSHTDVYFCFIRENPAVKTPEKYNVAYRLPKKVECHLYRELTLYFSLCLIHAYPVDVFLKSPEVKYVTLQDLDEVSELLERQEEEEPEVEEEQEPEDFFVDTTHSTCLMETFYKSWVIKTEIILCMDSFVFVCVSLCVPSVKVDDEIARTVFENRGTLPDMDSVTQLTADNFHDAVAQNSLTVALFYLNCKSLSTGLTKQTNVK